MAAATTAAAAEPARANALGSHDNENEKAMQTPLSSSNKAASQARSERLEQRRKLSQIRKDNRTDNRKA
jgi:hypothetical protein